MTQTFSNSGTFDGLNATLQLTVPNAADDDFLATIALSQSGVEPTINIAFAIDRSGSTANSTGIDFNGDGRNDTYLEAQIYAATLKVEQLLLAGYEPDSINITIVDFASTARSATFNLATEADDLLDYIDGLRSSGQTNFAAALREVENAWDRQGVSPTDETNILYFYSDGFPVPAGQDFVTPLNSLEAAYDPQITAVGFGPNSSRTALDIIDSSGRAAIVETDQDLLDLLNTPPPLPDVESFSIFVDGALIETIPIGDPRVIVNPTGFTISNLNVTGYPFTPGTPDTIDVQVVMNLTSGDTLAVNGPIPLLDGVVEGTAGDDLIDIGYTGDPEGDRIDNQDNVLDPSARGDALDNDVVEAGDGDDTVLAGNGDDEVFGGDGDDSIEGGTGDDTLLGQSGDDTLVGEDGDDVLDGGEGDDLLLGGDGADSLTGGPGDDVLDGGDDDDALNGGDGDDVLLGGDGADSIEGGTGDDTITLSGTTTLADRSADIATGRDDEDLFFGGGVGDTVIGGEGGVDNDTLDLDGSINFRIVYDPTDPTFDPATGISEAGQVIFFTDGTKTTESGRLTFTEIENVIPCFTPGARIATPRGEVPVESLREGDKVITRDNGLQEIRWVGTRTLARDELARAPHLKPILIRAGALGHGLPERDMLVSPQHRVLVAGERTQLYFEESEVLVAAKHLVNGGSICKMDTLRTTYIHFMFDRHEVVLSDGAWTESFQPGDQTLGAMGQDTREEIVALFPELANAEGITDYTAARRALKAHEAKLLQL